MDHVYLHIDELNNFRYLYDSILMTKAQVKHLDSDKFTFEDLKATPIMFKQNSDSYACDTIA